MLLVVSDGWMQSYKKHRQCALHYKYWSKIDPFMFNPAKVISPFIEIKEKDVQHRKVKNQYTILAIDGVNSKLTKYAFLLSIILVEKVWQLRLQYVSYLAFSEIQCLNTTAIKHLISFVV